MKTIIASLFTLLLLLTNGSAMADNLIKTGQWAYFADTVMGGNSEGPAPFENFADNSAKVSECWYS